jgi:hypothetical protein
MAHLLCGGGLPACRMAAKRPRRPETEELAELLADVFTVPSSPKRKRAAEVRAS